MANFLPVPSYADPVVLGKEDPRTGKAASQFNPVWLDYFLKLGNGGAAGTTNHNSLASLQGGQTGEYFHLTATQHGAVEYTTNKDVVSGYAGLNAQTRTTHGVVATDDLIVDLATKGLVLKDTQGSPHYWRITISTIGALIITDLGTTMP